jgi:hypothetical protein
MSKLSVCFIGFFGIKNNHVDKYIKLWNSLNASIDYYKYDSFKDLFNTSNHKKMRELFEPKKKHYDIIHCISGGSLYLHILLTSKQNFTYSKIIYDSGPYTFEPKQVEIYLNQTYPITKCLPIEKIVNLYNEDSYKTLRIEHKNTLYSQHEKLVLTNKLDKTIDQDFVLQFIDKSRAKHIEFYQGKHANLYNYNKEEYTQSLIDFINKN